jgi:hypothetical protein
MDSYECDSLYDCSNWHDEGIGDHEKSLVAYSDTLDFLLGSSCTSSLLTLDIVLGSIVGVIMIIVIVTLIVFVIYQDFGRVRARGLVFLTLNAVGTIIGLVSIFPYFGRPSDGSADS